jgi:uncharacterized membrane protein
LTYFLLFPEIKSSKVNEQKMVMEKTEGSAFDSVIRTLTDDERRVIQVLEKHAGKYLQKYIRKEAGLSRLKTHRILSRLAQRGIVTLEKTGNTNEVQLSEWLEQR